MSRVGKNFMGGVALQGFGSACIALCAAGTLTALAGNANSQQAQIAPPVPANASAAFQDEEPVFNFKPDWSRPLIPESMILTIHDEDLIEASLNKVNQKTRFKVGVVLVGSTKREPINAFAVRVGRAWDNAKSTVNPDVIIVLAKNDGVAYMAIREGLI